MTQENTINTIRAALRGMAAGDLAGASTRLLSALGYRSDFTGPEIAGGPGGFVATFPALNPNTQSERDFLADAESARLLFQMNDHHVAESAPRMLFDGGGFDTGNAQSFMFAAVQLRGDSYPRGRYAAFTRELNKRFPMPMVVLFRTADHRVTLAFVHRRPNKRDPERDVLGSVSLIREINPANPHRAHLDILAELSLPERLRWMDGHGQPHNFDGLLAAWLAALDTEELNKKFYRELFTWFERAVHTARFPDQEKVTLTAEEHVIRLITRLMFVWFIKEKGLVADDLFIENQVSQLLKDYDPDGGDSYYRAVLQNLFFATLNTEINERAFSQGGQPRHRVFSYYRYRNQMAQPDALRRLFDRSPFINGGLFDCLDSEAATGDGGYRIDCFSDVHYGKLSIPNHLFFAEHRDAPGLITLFNRYKFTVEENTPAEREVALDPELLGKVFENLLAAFNPETRENVRKQTGSYYTPRPVVDYMVDEALAATLAQKVAAQNVAAPPSDQSPSFPRKPESTSDSPSFPRKPESISDSPSFPRQPESTSDSPSFPRKPESPSDQSPSFPRKPESISDSPSFPRKPESMSDRLRSLLDYDLADADTLFTPAEKTAIVRAIAETRALDPAVGSGAFPMGILHKLTLALRRLDPGNQLWRELQREIATKRAADAFGTDDSAARERELEEISRTFDQYRDSDFGRKLYLIQNGIYGVDLQPVATQIAKLRFFISLAIEQQPNADPADNYGIRPLPNLETRFVAADTLLALGGLNRELVSPQTEDLQRQLNANRERHFHANTRSLKLRYRNRDRELRQQLADSLAASGLAADHATKVAAWDPYDQNARADWFDPQYMFGVSDGFDVVIGNPPYVVTKDNRLREIYAEGIYGRMNTYGLFIQRGLRLARAGGQLCYINPRTLLTDRYFTNLRKVVRRESELKGVVLIADRHNTFEHVLQECIILHLSATKIPERNHPTKIRSIHVPSDLTDPQAFISVGTDRVLLGDDYHGAFYVSSSEFEYQVFERMKDTGLRLDDFGLKAETGKVQFDKYKQFVQPTNARGACRLIWAENVQRYATRPSRMRVGKEWLSRGITSVLAPNITGMGIVTQRVSANEQPRRIIATLINAGDLGANSVYSENHTNFIPLPHNSNADFLLGVLNSSVVEFVFRHLNSNTQVSAGEINSLPFPPVPDASTLAQIDALVSELIALGGVDTPQESVRRAITIERELDVLIGALYGFSPAEVEQVQEMLPLYETVYGVGS